MLFPCLGSKQSQDKAAEWSEDETDESLKEQPRIHLVVHLRHTATASRPLARRKIRLARPADDHRQVFDQF